MRGVRIKSCPECGGKIEVSYLYQYARDFTLNKDGKLSKRYRVRDCGPMEVAVAHCICCNEKWDADDFLIGPNGAFYDYKE